MNIWLVTIGEPLPTEVESKKLRTALLADKLVEKGHSVVFFMSAFGHLKKKWIYENDTEVKISDKYHLKVLKGSGYKKNISLKRFADHRMIAKKFRNLAPTLAKPDIIVASMPPHDLAYEVVMYAKRNHIPVLVDIRDPWPDVFLQAFPEFVRKFLKLILHKEFYFISQAMKSADGLIATTSTLLDWGMNYAGRKISDRDKVIYLGQKKNSNPEIADVEKKWREESEKIKNKFIVFFFGTFAHYHSPLILIEAAKKLSENKNIHFVIAGDGEIMPEIKKQSENLLNVTLTGWLNQNDLEFWLSKSKAGACTTPQHVDIVPNKTGTYLSANLPLVSSFQGDLKTMIEQDQIGFYYAPGDAESLAQNILKLYDDKVLYERMSANAKKIFAEKFDAEKVYEQYVRHIEVSSKNFKR